MKKFIIFLLVIAILGGVGYYVGKGMLDDYSNQRAVKQIVRKFETEKELAFFANKEGDYEHLFTDDLIEGWSEEPIRKLFDYEIASRKRIIKKYTVRGEDLTYEIESVSIDSPEARVVVKEEYSYNKAEGEKSVYSYKGNEYIFSLTKENEKWRISGITSSSNMIEKLAEYEDAEAYFNRNKED